MVIEGSINTLSPVSSQGGYVDYYINANANYTYKCLHGELKCPLRSTHSSVNHPEV